MSYNVDRSQRGWGSCAICAHIACNVIYLNTILFIGKNLFAFTFNIHLPMRRMLIVECFEQQSHLAFVKYQCYYLVKWSTCAGVKLCEAPGQR